MFLTLIPYVTMFDLAHGIHVLEFVSTMLLEAGQWSKHDFIEMVAIV